MSVTLEDKLFSSDAAESLRMEHFISKCFHSLKWPAEQGVYFTDRLTKKAREIDVICRHVFQQRVHESAIGAPLINLSVICECKSLSGWNILLQKGGRDWHEIRMVPMWSGYEDHTKEIVEQIVSDPFFGACNPNALYSYYVERAFPDGLALVHELDLIQPPVSLIANSFRPTKGGRHEQNRGDRDASNPVWNAMRSVLDATTAIKERSLAVTKSYTMDYKPYATDRRSLLRNFAFFYDAELARREMVHPIVFCKARLFELTDSIVEVPSARVFVRSLEFDHDYVDIVNYDHAKSYIGAMVADFEKQATKSLRKTSKRFAELKWQPGQQEAKLAKALGLSNRPRR